MLNSATEIEIGDYVKQAAFVGIWIRLGFPDDTVVASRV